MTGRGQHLLLYDGVCGLCDRLVQVVLARDRRAMFDLAALQGDAARAALARWAVNPADLDTVYVVVDYHGATPRLLARGRAALFVLTALGGPWRAAGMLRLLPPALLNWGYDLVARHRYAWFGRYDQCVAPRPEHRARFLDAPVLQDRPTNARHP